MRSADSETTRAEIGPLIGVPALGLDALCSAAYGPEAALTLTLTLTLTLIVVILASLLAGIALLCRAYGLGATAARTIKVSSRSSRRRSFVLGE